MHDNQTPKLPTIESLDNIEEHYYQIDQDANITFSDNDDNDQVSEDDFFEPQFDLNELPEEEKVEVSKIDEVVSNSSLVNHYIKYSLFYITFLQIIIKSTS